MRLPNRKPGKYTFPTFDYHITQETYDRLEKKLKHLERSIRPRLIQEVQEHAQNGDFSENAEYQIAKGKLRGINRTIDELQHRLTHAQIIAPMADTEIVAIGHTVTLSNDSHTMQFRILGQSETRPDEGIISHQSPLGVALLGKKKGDTVTITTKTGSITYTILSISIEE